MTRGMNLPAAPRLSTRMHRRQALLPWAHYSAWKRCFDLISATVALALSAPLILIVALLIKLEDGGPVFFSQVRVGKGGRRFRFWKFRSMCVDAEARLDALSAQSEDASRFKLRADPRITRVGALLRRSSLDELPQLFNVLAGDMSLVGPRPALPVEVADYDARALGRLDVEQGLTCTWQVSGRSLLSFDEQIDLDLDYVERRSLLLDISLLLRTVPAVLLGRGAY